MVRVKREELADQISAGNRLLAGLDSYGSHATLYIDDEDTRKYLEFDSEDGKRKQNVINDEKVQKLSVPDGISPNEEGYRIIAEHIASQIIQRIEQ